MGGCQSKKDGKTPKTINKKSNLDSQTPGDQSPLQSPSDRKQNNDRSSKEHTDSRNLSSNKLKQKNNGNDSKSENQNNLSSQKINNMKNQTPQEFQSQHQVTPRRHQDQNSHSGISLFLDPNSPEFDNSVLDIIEASFRGNLVLVEALIEKFNLKDISTLIGFDMQVRVGKGRQTKQQKNTNIWNPLLYAIAGRQEAVVKALFEKIPTFHRINCLAKPFTIDQQKDIAFDHVKRIKRESFALKLSILNHDDKTFKYLWNENRILWNLGHFMQCLRKIIKGDWDMGLKILMASTTTKVIFMSINEVHDFIDCIDLIRQELILSESSNPKIGIKLKEYLFSRPYYIYAIFMEIADFGDKPDRDYLQSCLSKLSQDDIQFKHKDLKQLFDILDDTNCLEQFRDRLLMKFENRDSEIERYQRGLARIFEKESSVDSKDHLSILEELDLFAFNSITVNGEVTNAMIQALKRGFEHMIKYCFDQNEGFLNLRSIIRKNNKFEVQNDIAQMHVEFFQYQGQNFNLFKHIYYNLIDLYQLSNFLEVFDKLAEQNSIQVISFIITEPKFLSLFQTSLELQKYLFISEVVELTDRYELSNIKKIIQQIPYKKYQQEVKKGNIGISFTKKTLTHLEKLEEKKEDQIIKKKQKLLKSRGSGLIEFTAFSSNSPSRSRTNTIIQNDDEKAPYKANAQKKQSVLLTPVQEQTSERRESEFDEKNLGKSLNLVTQSRDKPIPKLEMNKNHSENPNFLGVNQKQKNQLANQSPKNSQSGRKNSARKSNADSPRGLQKKSSLRNVNGNALLNSSDTKSSQDEQLKMQDIVLLKKDTGKTNKLLETQESLLNIQLDTQKDKLDFLKSLKKEQDSINVKKLDTKDSQIHKQKVNKGKKESQDTYEDNDHDIDSADASDDDDNNKSRQMSQRLPNIMHKKQSTKNPINDIVNAKETDAKGFERLPKQILESISTNNIQLLKYLLAKYNIKNVTWIKHIDQADILEVKGSDLLSPSKSSKNNSRKGSPDKSIVKDNKLSHDVSMWNPVLFAIYHQRTDMVKLLLEKYVTNFTMAIRLPPVNEFTEYIIPGQKPVLEQWGRGRGMNFQNDIDNSFIGGGSPEHDNNNLSQINIPFNPSDARVECFGIELAIRNQDIQTLMYLWNEQPGMWEERHFAFVLDKILQQHWDIGLGCIFRSKTSHLIFKALNPEDKDNFLFSKIVDKITDTEYWEREQFLDQRQKPTQITEKQVQIVVEELQHAPYGSYACLKYPKLFMKFKLLESTLQRVKYDDIYDYVIARKENFRHLQDFIAEEEKSNNLKSKLKEKLQSVLTQAQEIEQSKRRTPNDPKDIVQLIKLGDLNKLKEYFEKDDNKQRLEQLNQLQGHIDNDYQKMYQSNVKYIPSDETIQILLADNSTYEWNPLIFALFYQKKEMVEYFCENKSVYVRNCLTTPFIIEVDEDAEDLDEEKFIKEKTEMFCLVMCIMLHNKEIFKYLWRKCAYMWNDIHFVALANFIFESQWSDGIKVLFASANTHQIFNAMNMYEKEKFLKFCDKSISKINPAAIKDFRYQMSFDPYNIYYLPIVATREDLQAWDKDETSKELFIKNCHLNFDERSFAMLSKLNSHYVGEFISTAEGNSSEVILNFARKLRRYIGQSLQF